jgi:hypothetical protein
MQNFLSFCRMTQIGDRIFRSTEANISCNILSEVATREHANSASSPTRLQSIVGGRKLGEPDRSSPNTLEFAVLTASWSVTASTGAAPPGALMWARRVSKSRSKCPMSSFSWGLAPST